jgi:hypothetical protein
MTVKQHRAVAGSGEGSPAGCATFLVDRGFTWYLTVKQRQPRAVAGEERHVPSDYEIGLLVGLLVGEGHFGGDGRQPQITLRMHVRHEAMFRWLERTFPGGKLYGPYDHGGRHYYQWMARGPYLRDHLVPLLAGRLSPQLDQHSYERFEEMRHRYAAKLSTGAARAADTADAVDTASTAAGPDGGAAIPDAALPDAAGVFSRLRGSEQP